MAYDDINPLGSDFVTNTDSALEIGPRNFALASGDGLIVTSFQTYGGYYDETAQRFTDSGGVLSGTVNVRTDQNAGAPTTSAVAALTGGGYVVVSSGPDGPSTGPYQTGAAVIPPSATGAIYFGLSSDSSSPPAVAALANGGFVAEWGQGGGEWVQTFDASGQRTGAAYALSDSSYQPAPPTFVGVGSPVLVGLPSGGFVATSPNGITTFDGSAYHTLATTGMPVEAGALLGSGQVELVWTQTADGSTGIYAQAYDPSSNSLVGDPTLVDRASGDLSPHIAATPDGGYVVSWRLDDSGAFEARAVGPDGLRGPVQAFTGDVLGVDSSGDLISIKTDASGHITAAAWSLSPSSAAGTGGEVVHTSDASYVAPNTVAEIYLTGANQTVTANNNGDIIWSDDTVNHLVGGTGSDTFHLGRAGDIVAGGGGADTFAYDAMPWGGGQITDFQAGDVVDLSGLMSTTADTGASGFADGYLKITDDGQGDAQVWAQYATSGSSSGWWLVTTLAHVAAADLQTAGDLISMAAGSNSGGGSGSTVYTSDADYAAPDGVTTIYLTGAQQSIHANNAGDTIFSDNTVNHLYGGTGNDTFHLGRAGDIVSGGGGTDTFDFAEVPWAGGHITDFGGADVLDLSGLMSTTADTGSSGFSDGYLKITDDGQGDAQVWAQYATSGSDSGWWLVTTLDHVAASGLQTSGDLVTVAGSASSGGPQQTSVTTSDANYVAPSYVTAITLTGSGQHIDASATNGVTINDDNGAANTLIGGAGADTIYIGRDSNTVSGGAGADTFVFEETPWHGSAITDFSQADGDRLDVSGLLAKMGYTGSDPFADHHLEWIPATDASTGKVDMAFLYANYQQAGNSDWWMVAQLDNVDPSSLHYSNGLIT